jgi:major inositol transporter-like SP family MFS transporter
MYIAELAPPHLRGALVTTTQVCICTGVLIGYGVTAAVSPYWRWEFAAATPMAVLLFLSFVFESQKNQNLLLLLTKN